MPPTPYDANRDEELLNWFKDVDAHVRKVCPLFPFHIKAAQIYGFSHSFRFCLKLANLAKYQPKHRLFYATQTSSVIRLTPGPNASALPLPLSWLDAILSHLRCRIDIDQPTMLLWKGIQVWPQERYALKDK
jgi:hypothetical protein